MKDRNLERQRLHDSRNRRMMVARDQEEGKTGNCCSTDIVFQLCKMNKV